MPTGPISSVHRESPAHRAVIVGAGIGGLTAALELRRVGFDVAVLERRSELGEVDTGFFLWSFAVKRLKALGVGAELERIGRPVERLVTKSWQGKALSDLSLGGLNDQAGTASYDVHRAGLQRLLADALGDEALRLGARCVGAGEDSARASVRLESGEEVAAELVLGADGVNSAIRQKVVDDVTLRRDGVAIWRGIAELPSEIAPDGVHIRVMGPGALFGIGRLGRRARWYAGAWTGGRPSSRSGEQKSNLNGLFGGWCDPVGEAIEATAEEAILVNDAPRAAPLRRWVGSRIALLGDAAHPTLPTLASGGGMAIEDAAVLAECLEGDAAIPDALHRYERLRRHRAARVQRTATAFGGGLRIRSTPGMPARELALGQATARVQRRALAWLMEGP